MVKWSHSDTTRQTPRKLSDWTELLCEPSAERNAEFIVSMGIIMATPNQLNTLRQDALALSESDRATLARDLVASLDGPEDPDAAKAWDIELCRRINEIDAGNAELLDADDVLSRVKERLNKL